MFFKLKNTFNTILNADFNKRIIFLSIFLMHIVSVSYKLVFSYSMRTLELPYVLILIIPIICILTIYVINCLNEHYDSNKPVVLVIQFIWLCFIFAIVVIFVTPNIPFIIAFTGIDVFIITIIEYIGNKLSGLIVHINGPTQNTSWRNLFSSNGGNSSSGGPNQPNRPENTGNVIAGNSGDSSNDFIMISDDSDSDVEMVDRPNVDSVPVSDTPLVKNIAKTRSSILFEDILNPVKPNIEIPEDRVECATLDNKDENGDIIIPLPEFEVKENDKHRPRVNPLIECFIPKTITRRDWKPTQWGANVTFENNTPLSDPFLKFKRAPNMSPMYTLVPIFNMPNAIGKTSLVGMKSIPYHDTMVNYDSNLKPEATFNTLKKAPHITAQLININDPKDESFAKFKLANDQVVLPTTLGTGLPPYGSAIFSFKNYVFVSETPGGNSLYDKSTTLLNYELSNEKRNNNGYAETKGLMVLTYLRTNMHPYVLPKEYHIIPSVTSISHTDILLINDPDFYEARINKIGEKFRDLYGVAEKHKDIAVKEIRNYLGTTYTTIQDVTGIYWDLWYKYPVAERSEDKFFDLSLRLPFNHAIIKKNLDKVEESAILRRVLLRDWLHSAVIVLNSPSVVSDKKLHKKFSESAFFAVDSIHTNNTHVDFWCGTTEHRIMRSLFYE